MAPAAWIADDIAAARKDPAVQHIFLLGHKPAVVDTTLYTEDGDKIMNIAVIKSIWKAMDSNRVEAMLSAHSHQYDRLQPDPDMAYQVIAGNGGSRYEHKAKDDISRQFFGYSVIYIMKNGQVMLESRGRTMCYDEYMDPVPDTVLTTVRDRVNISWGTNNGTWNPGTMASAGKTKPCKKKK